MKVVIALVFILLHKCWSKEEWSLQWPYEVSKMKVTLEKSKFSIENQPEWFTKVACSFWIKIMTSVNIRKELYPERFFYLHPKTRMVYYSSGDVTFYKEKGYHVTAVFKIAYLSQDFNRQYKCFLKVRLPYEISRRRVSSKYFTQSGSFMLHSKDLVLHKRLVSLIGRKRKVYHGAGSKASVIRIGSDFERYKFSCTSSFSPLTYPVWEFYSNFQGLKNKRQRANLPDDVHVVSTPSASKLTIKKLSTTITGWYGCAWHHKMQPMFREKLNAEVQLLPVDDDSCRVAYQVLKRRPCHSAAYCIDKAFSHECYCQEGYTGDGLDYCDDIDECIMSLSRCDLHASCINTQGGYKCSCDHGYHGDGWKCSLSDFDYNMKIPVQIENTQIITVPPKLREQKYDKNLTTRAIKETNELPKTALKVSLITFGTLGTLFLIGLGAYLFFKKRKIHLKDRRQKIGSNKKDYACVQKENTLRRK